MARIALVVAAVALAGCDSPEQRAQRHFDRGLELTAAGDDSKAALEFRNALRLARDFPGARFELGKLHERQGNLSAAVGNLRAAVELDPANTEARRRLGALLLVGGDVEGARAQLDEAVRLAPDDQEARLTRALAMQRAGEFEAARAEARSVLDEDPEAVSAHLLLASLDAAAGDLDAAIARIDAGLARNPDELSYNLVRLRLLEQAGRVDQIGPQLARLVELQPDERQLRQALAQWRLGAGDADGAEADLRALAASGDPADVGLLAGFLREQRGVDAARAELATRRAAETAPEKRAALMRLEAELELRNGDVALGEAMLRRIVDEPGDAAALRDARDSARIRLAMLALADGDKAAAGALAAEVLAGDEANAEALALRAALAIDDLRPEDAIADLRRAQQEDPDNARYALLEATAQERAGNMAAASERLAAATRISDFEPEYALRYATFLAGRDETTAAEAALAESARRHPEDLRVLSALADARLRLGDWAGADAVAAALRGVEGGAVAASRVSAAVLRGLGRLEDSRELLEQLAESDPDGSLAPLFSDYLRAGDVDRARALLDEALARDATDLRALLLHAELDLATGETDRAAARLQDIVALRPDSAIGHRALVRLYLASGRVDEAEASVRRGLELAPEDQGLQIQFAQILETRGDFDGAIAAYERLYALNPDSIVAANNLASLIADHRPDDAAAVARATRVAQRLRGYDQPHFQDTYGWLLFLQGAHAEAAPILAAAAEALPDNPLVRYHAGEALAAVGELEAARSHLEAALAIDPEFPRAAAAKARLTTLP